MDPQKVGAVIKKLRVQAGYTQHSIAECLNVTDKAVSKWERGLSIPDVSIIAKLSLLLNCDIDNLLEGNITYLESSWQGLLLLKDHGEIYSGSMAFGKPLVYFFLSYFMLAGIGSIYISCPERDKCFIESTIGDGSKYGIRLIFLESDVKTPETIENTMVVYEDPFIYGPNLTKYFQRAMSRQEGISVLTVEKSTGHNGTMISYDKHRAVKYNSCDVTNRFCTPFVFFPKKYFSQVKNAEKLMALHPLYAEPLGNGMIEYSITDDDALLDTAVFLRYLKKKMGKDVYNIEEIARNRFFI